MTESQYAKLGVDAGKQSVRQAFAGCINNDFPGAFVNIIRDPTRRGEVFTQHMDGDGSKFIQRILNYRENGDPSVFRGAADDALSMNMGDIAASGFVSGVITVTDVLNLNGSALPKQIIMEQIAKRFSELMRLYREYGFQVYFLGGETADLPHQVRTVAFDVAVHARAKEKDIIRGNVKPGDVIWGFSSAGQAAWEDTPNSGIMSNGLTLARMSLMSEKYNKKYPDLVMPGKVFSGRFMVAHHSMVPGIDMSIDQALLSPTRQWAILIKILLDKLRARKLTRLLHGITMNTGGGATKCLHLGTGGILYQKCMPHPPGIFHLIQEESGEDWRDMYQDFNCGIGIDVIGDERLRPILSEVAEATHIRLYELGVCQAFGQDNNVTLQTPFGYFNDY